MLRSLDLFSGIGGMTLALHGIATPVAYCDRSLDAQRVLQHNIRRRLLPDAPISDDVRHMDARWLRSNVQGTPEMVVAGFPCTGMSTAGGKLGFADPDTALFFEVMRIIDITRPKCVFMENSPNILNLGMRRVVEEFTRRGYDLRYCLMSACNVGAPHRRLRWFCLAVQSGFLHSWKQLRYTAFSWDREPQRMDLSPVGYRYARFRCLGYSVVPDVVRAAFMFLAAGFVPVAIAATSLTLAPVGLTKRVTDGLPFPKAGVVTSKRTIWRAASYPSCSITESIELVPGAFKSSKPPAKALTSGMLVAPKVLTLWGTPGPRLGTANYLSQRNNRMIHVQLRFEKNTPDHLRKGRTSPGFLEWLMGYPPGWTAVLESPRPSSRT
jgi:DNA (cytosine-5)-methyltransferase 1